MEQNPLTTLPTSFAIANLNKVEMNAPVCFHAFVLTFKIRTKCKIKGAISNVLLTFDRRKVSVLL